MISGPIAGLPLRTWLGADRTLSDEQVAKRLTIGHEFGPDPGLFLGGLSGALIGGAIAPLMGVKGLAEVVGVALGVFVVALAGAAAQQLHGFRASFPARRPTTRRPSIAPLKALGIGPRLDIDAAEVALRPPVPQDRRQFPRQQ